MVLLSGGLDSAVTLARAIEAGFRAFSLAIDYGQRHRLELDAAALVSAQIGAAGHRVVRLDLRAIGGSALTADIEVPKDRDEAALSAGVPITYVPARNLTFLSIAAGYAEVLGATDLFVGVNAVDYSGYPDCRPAFIESFERCVRVGTKAGSEGAAWRVHTPLVRMSKAEIIREGARLGVDLSRTTSCYDPGAGGGACGHCDSCQIRARGFREAGVADPTRYAERAR